MVVVALVGHGFQRTVICESTRVTPSCFWASAVAIDTWSCDFAVPVRVTTPLLVATLMSVSLSPESAANAAFTLPVVRVSLTAPVALPAGPGAIVVVAAVLGDEVSAVAVEVVVVVVVEGALVVLGLSLIHI